MLVVMQQGATEAQIQAVIDRLVGWDSMFIVPRESCTPCWAAWVRWTTSIPPPSK